MKKLLQSRTYTLLFILGLLNSYGLQAQVWTSVQEGNWNNPATWGSSSYPPATLNSGMTVNIGHTVTLKNNFTSNLNIKNGAILNIISGTFLVETGISMDNRGRFTGINGSLLQCLYVGCGPSGSQASGVWNTIDGGYTRMENMIIQIAQDWTTNNNGRRYILNCCVKTGQNFSINHEGNRDTLINSRFELGLHASGNFQQNKGKVIYDNIDIDIAGSGGGNVQFAGGTFSGTIRTIRIQDINGNIQASSSMSGSIDLNYYCIQVSSNYLDPANMIKNEVKDCATVDSLLSLACVPGTGAGGEEEPRLAARQRETDAYDLSSRAVFYPNPFVQGLTIQFMLDKMAEVSLVITDISGKQVYQTRKEGIAGLNSITADRLVALLPGVYMAEIKTNGEILSRTRVVKK